MANHKSAAKRARQTVKRNAVNRVRRTKLRTVVKAADAAVEAKDKKALPTAVKAAASSLAKAASKGIIRKNTASRKTSRLAKAANKIAKAGK